MMNFLKHKTLKFVFLTLISLKIVVFVYEYTISYTNIEKTCLVEIDSEQDSENDFEKNENENEIDEIKNIHSISYQFVFCFNPQNISKKHNNKSDNYTTQYLEFITPPPEYSML